MKKGRNVWECGYCGKVWKGEEKRPQHCVDKGCKSEWFLAKYPHGRVKKGVYRYYTGNDDWTKDANAGMKLDAKSQMRKW